MHGTLIRNIWHTDSLVLLLMFHHLLLQFLYPLNGQFDHNLLGGHFYLSPVSTLSSANQRTGFKRKHLTFSAYQLPCTSISLTFVAFMILPKISLFFLTSLRRHVLGNVN